MRLVPDTGGHGRYYSRLRPCHCGAAIGRDQSGKELYFVFVSPISVNWYYGQMITKWACSGFLHLAAGLSVGLAGLAAGYSIGIVGDVVGFYAPPIVDRPLRFVPGRSIVHAAVSCIRGHGPDINLRRGLGAVWVSRPCCNRLLPKLMMDRLIVALILHTRAK